MNPACWLLDFRVASCRQIRSHGLQNEPRGRPENMLSPLGSVAQSLSILKIDQPKHRYCAFCSLLVGPGGLGCGCRCFACCEDGLSQSLSSRSDSSEEWPCASWAMITSPTLSCEFISSLPQCRKVMAFLSSDGIAFIFLILAPMSK